MRKWIGGVPLALTFVLAAETTARIDDRIRLGTPLSAVPDRLHDLVLQTPVVIRGRPSGRFKKWRLNQFGFRNEEMTLEAQAGCERIVVLGASETFGLYESEGNEFPAQLGRTLNAAGCYEVVNAAVAGLAIPGILQLWDRWVGQFKPRTVVVYPTPAFYLANAPPAPPHPSPEADPPWWTPRLWDRAHDVIHYPAFIQHRRVARWVAEARSAHDPQWLFPALPQDRLRQFIGDVDNLVSRIAGENARVILVTHATAFHRPAEPDEADELLAFNLFSPRASERMLLDFEDAAARGLIDLGARRGIPVVDAAAEMNGCHSWFAEDFIHFSDEGAARIASLIAAKLVPQSHAVQ
jgi:lysophospholipase L1-like esterase